MSLFSGVADDLKYWQRHVSMAVQRAKPGPLLVRGTVLLAGVMGLALALPVGQLGVWGGAGVAALALLTTFAPRSPLPTVLILMAVVGSIIRSAGQPADSLLRLLLLAGALYVVHTGSALSAVLPFDAVLAPGALGRWFMRAGLVMIATGVIGVGLLSLTGYLGQWHYLAILLFGLAIATGIAALLVRMVRTD